MSAPDFIEIYFDFSDFIESQDPDWEEELRQAVAKLGWSATNSRWYGSATHPDPWYGIDIRSDGRELDAVRLCNVLAELGLVEGVVINRNCGASTYVDEKWWDTCSDPRGLIAVAQRLTTNGRLRCSDRKASSCACAAGRFCTRPGKDKVEPILEVLKRYADRTANKYDVLAVHAPVQEDLHRLLSTNLRPNRGGRQLDYLRPRRPPRCGLCQ
jgi:hypothetical protein